MFTLSAKESPFWIAPFSCSVCSYYCRLPNASAVPAVHQFSVSTVDIRCRVSTDPLVTTSGGVRPSPAVDSVVTVNHAFLCMDIGSCAIAPPLIGFAAEDPASSSAICPSYGDYYDGGHHLDRPSDFVLAAPIIQSGSLNDHYTGVPNTVGVAASGSVGTRYDSMSP